MKTMFTIIILSFTLAFSQNNPTDQIKKENEALKKENQKLTSENNFLKQKLEFFTELSKPKDPRVLLFNDKIDIKITSVRGNPVTQTVKIDFIVTNYLPNQDLTFLLSYGSNKYSAVDNIGNELILKSVKLGNATGNIHFTSNKILTEVPLKGSFEVSNLLTSTDIIKAFTIPVNYKPSDSNVTDISTSLSFKDLKIEW